MAVFGCDPGTGRGGGALVPLVVEPVTPSRWAPTWRRPVVVMRKVA